MQPALNTESNQPWDTTQKDHGIAESVTFAAANFIGLATALSTAEAFLIITSTLLQHDAQTENSNLHSTFNLVLRFL
jgi:Na+(H+)/acetate symporter ActP